MLDKSCKTSFYQAPRAKRGEKWVFLSGCKSRKTDLGVVTKPAKAAKLHSIRLRGRKEALKPGCVWLRNLRHVVGFGRFCHRFFGGFVPKPPHPRILVVLMSWILLDSDDVFARTSPLGLGRHHFAAQQPWKFPCQFPALVTAEFVTAGEFADRLRAAVI
jgi:hypothetical protein